MAEGFVMTALVVIYLAQPELQAGLGVRAEAAELERGIEPLHHAGVRLAETAGVGQHEIGGTGLWVTVYGREEGRFRLRIATQLLVILADALEVACCGFGLEDGLVDVHRVLVIAEFAHEAAHFVLGHEVCSELLARLSQRCSRLLISAHLLVEEHQPEPGLDQAPVLSQSSLELGLGFGLQAQFPQAYGQLAVALGAGTGGDGLGQELARAFHIPKSQAFHALDMELLGLGGWAGGRGIGHLEGIWVATNI
jgi:hypothetical protein